MSKANYYAVVPYPVLADTRLTDFEKLLYAVISGLTNQHGYCFATNAYFEMFLGKSERTVKRGISKLSQLKYVFPQVDQANGNTRKIYIIPPSDKNGTTPSDKNDTSPSDKNDPTHSYNKKSYPKGFNNSYTKSNSYRKRGRHQGPDVDEAWFKEYWQKFEQENQNE